MCLEIKEKKSFIAQEDIVVFKCCIIDDNYTLNGKNVRHKYSKTEKAPLRISKVYGGYSISSGLHANRNGSSSSINTSWIIPKGSRYYQDKYQIVSNKLVFKEFINEDINFDASLIVWAKPSIKRFLLKWKRYIQGDY